MRIDFSCVGDPKHIPPLLLLPGWCNDRSAFSKLIPLLARSRYVVAMDWRGHGSSEQGTADFGNAELLDDAMSVIDALCFDRIVPVAMAQAGWIAGELCRKLGTRIPQLILIDWLMSDPDSAFLDTIAALQDSESWEPARAALATHWQGPTASPEIKTFMSRQLRSFGFEMWSRSAREIGAAYRCWKNPLSALKSLSDPPSTLHLYSLPDNAHYLNLQLQFAHECPWFQVRKLTGKTHYPTVEIPETVAEEILLFLTKAQSS